MRYMLFIKHSENQRSLQVPQSLYDAMGKFVTGKMATGEIVDTAGLKPTSEGSVVKSSGGKLTVVDGPFAESKEIVGGYALVDVKSREAAMELAREFMELHVIHFPEFEAMCELRPLEDFDAPPA